MMNEMLHSGSAQARLAELKRLVENQPKPQLLPQFCNNHVHTYYSFSPYSPCEAVYYARLAGLPTVGIMDHDSVAGAEEFLLAGKIASMGVTVGAECRADMRTTPLAGRSINNPDQKGVAYVSLHGIPQRSLAAVTEFFRPMHAARGARNQKILANINAITAAHGIVLEYERDVLAISKAGEGGSVTERHLSCALANAVLQTAGQGQGAIALCESFGIALSESQKASLAQPAEDYAYRLISVFKGGLLPRVYVDATDELADIHELARFCKEQGIILAYPYLGDVVNSVTGDKKAQKFEDEYLDELVPLLKELGFFAVTYMPARNTLEQLTRVQQLCRRYGLFEISGEDINMPSQSFLCPKLAEPQFAHLVEATYALIGHEVEAQRDLSLAITASPAETPLDVLVPRYAKVGMESQAG